MTGTEIVISVLGLGIIWGTAAVVRQIIRSRTDNKNITESTKHALSMSQEETKKIEAVGNSMARIMQLAQAKSDVENIGQELLKSIRDASQTNTNSVSTDKQPVHEPSRDTREPSRDTHEASRDTYAVPRDTYAAPRDIHEAPRDIQLNGRYSITEVSFKHEEAIKLQVRNRGSGQEFYATFQDNSLDRRQLSMLKDAAFEKKAIFMVINGTELRGQITAASILEVQRIED